MRSTLHSPLRSTRSAANNMQVTNHSCRAVSSGLRQPPRTWPSRAAGPLLHKGCIHARHAHRAVAGRSVTLAVTAQSESPTTQTNSATSPDEAAVPLVSENAAAEVPNAEVASQDDLAAAQEKSQAGPSSVATDISSSSGQAPQASRGTGGRARQQKRPRTVEVTQLQPGAEFEGTVVSVLAYGAFVDIGAVTDGLVHVSQMSDLFVSDPNNLVQNGQTVSVKVSSWDAASNRLSLTMKLNSGSNGAADGGSFGDDGQTRRNPRQGKVATAGGRKNRKGSSQPIPVNAGDVLKDAKVQSALSWGAFIDVGNGHQGLLHVDEMVTPEGVAASSAFDIVKEGQVLEGVRVLKVAGGKIQLTMKTEEDRQAEADMKQSGAGTVSTRKFRNTLEHALVQAGYKPPKKKESEDTTSKPAGDAVVAAEAPADTQTQGNQASVHLHSDAQKEALDRQINPRGEPTPMELPPQAQQAADAPSADEAAMEGDDSPSGTADHSSTKEVTAPQDDKSPSSPALVEVAEGAGAKEGADADTATITASTDGGASDAPSPSGGDKGVPEAALEGGQGAPPKGESTPVELPAEAEKPAQDGKEGALEGQNPDAVKQIPGTDDQTDKPEVTAPEQAEPAAPTEVAEGEETPAETKAEAKPSPGSSHSAAALSGADSASELPQVHAQAAEQAAPAKPVGQQSTEAERTDPLPTAPPPTAAATAVSPSSVPDSVPSGGAGSSSPSAGGGSKGAFATSVTEAKQETGASGGNTVSAASVKQLRQETGAGMMDCKRALTQANGDIQLATEALRKKGLAQADKKAGRIAAEGLLAQYIHAGSRLGVLVEVNCETDFVARGAVFKELANDMAMQVAACSQVTVVDTADVPAHVVEKERSIQMEKEDILTKPEAIRPKIVDGRIQKFVAEQALLEQAFIKDTTKTVATVIKEAVANVGEKISIRRFERFHLGEGITKKESDLAADVEEQQQALQAKAAERKEQPAAAAAPADPQQPEQPAVKVDAKLVKQLRESSGAGMMDCKKALASNDNDLQKASDFLRKKGLASADKKAGRVASEGAIGSYVHAGSKLGVLIEVNCETDFVARGAKFKELVQDMAMQAAASPSAIVVSTQEVPEDEMEKERQIEMGKEDIQNKPEAIRPKIVEGRLAKIRSQKALLEQPYIKDTGSTVAEHIKSAVASLGENIQIRRFVRYNLGEGIEKKTQDFAAEVAAQTGQ
ncbi:hypothetical protein ABBQ32_000242 [Trebouxia sp. C0010 RCD-2024]